VLPAASTPLSKPLSDNDFNEFDVSPIQMNKNKTKKKKEYNKDEDLKIINDIEKNWAFQMVGGISLLKDI
jgi:hypothetical protein